MSGVYVDELGVPVVAEQAATVGELDRAVRGLVYFRPEMRSHLQRSLRIEPGNVLARCLDAYIAVLSTEFQSWWETRRAVEDFCRSADLHQRAGTRERMHLRAVRLMLTGRAVGSAHLLDEIVRRWPRDLMAVVVSHHLRFFLGQNRAMRSVLEYALPHWADHPERGPVLGMYAFSLVENGEFGAARDVGQEAVERSADDVWALHAVAHSYEMCSAADEGLAWLGRHQPHWSRGTGMTIHLWWHQALFHLGREDHRSALDVYDRQVDPATTASPTILNLLDASSLLWRLSLEGIDVGDRFRRLGVLWPADIGPAHSAFNDVHAIMCFIGCQRVGAARELIEARRRETAEPARGHGAVTTARLGLSVGEALLAFGEGRYQACVDRMWPVRGELVALGGSHAQRDVLQQTLIEACLRAGDVERTDRAMSERREGRAEDAFDRRRRRQVALPAAAGGVRSEEQM